MRSHPRIDAALALRTRGAPRLRPPRRGPAVAAIAAASLAAAFAAAMPAPSRADDTPTAVPGTSRAGYPRSSDALPPSPETDEWGKENPDGRTYDTNWIWAASAGDSNTIWLHVSGATIRGTAHVSNDDVESVKRLSKRAWGEDRIGFSVPETAEGDVTIHVKNTIEMDAAWHLDPKGDHYLYLDALARDVNGGTHPLKVERASNCPAQVSTRSVSGFTLGATDTDTKTTGEDGPASSDSETAGIGLTLIDETSKTVVSGDGDIGSVSYDATVYRSFHGRTCDVAISSTELITVATRPMEDDHESYIEVPKFDTVNWVTAAYSIVPAGSGPGTPGGDLPPGVGTPGGDTGDGASPTAPSGGTGTGPITPSGTSGEEPEEQPIAPPDDDPDDAEDLPPPSGDPLSGGSTTTSGSEPSSGGTDLGGETGTSGEGTAPSTSGSEPAPAPGTGTSGDGSLPSSGSDPLDERPAGGGSQSASGGVL